MWGRLSVLAVTLNYSTRLSFATYLHFSALVAALSHTLERRSERHHCISEVDVQQMPVFMKKLSVCSVVQQPAGPFQFFYNGVFLQAGSSSSQARPSATAAPKNLTGLNGKPCPFAGRIVSRTTKCPASKKSWKNCCGKKAPMLQVASA